MEFTPPFDTIVVRVPHKTEFAVPSLTSLPSIFSPATPIFSITGLGWDSDHAATPRPVTSSIIITANMASPCFMFFIRYPKVNTSAMGIMSIASVSRRFVKPLGFSNGCAEFTLKKPPPFEPSSLIASWEATGPMGMVWLVPSIVWAVT